MRTGMSGSSALAPAIGPTLAQVNATPIIALRLAVDTRAQPRPSTTRRASSPEAPPFRAPKGLDRDLPGLRCAHEEMSPGEARGDTDEPLHQRQVLQNGEPLGQREHVERVPQPAQRLEHELVALLFPEGRRQEVRELGAAERFTSHGPQTRRRAM